MHCQTISRRREPAPLGHSQARHQVPRQVLPLQQFLVDHQDRVFIKEQTCPGEQRVRDRFIHGDLATTSCCFYLGMPPPPTRYGGKGSARCSPSLLAGYPHALLGVDDACVQHYETRAWGGGRRITPIHCPAVMTVPEDGNIGPQGPHVESKTFYYRRLSFIMHTYE